MDVRYVIISPVRNEARFVQKTIDSVVAQSVRPVAWVIVDDGSTDGTGALVDAAACTHNWIKVVHRPDRGYRKQGGGVMEAFYDGYATLGGERWDFIVKLDCDLSFGSEYFEEVFRKFSLDPRLGIGSGIYSEPHGGNAWVEVKMPMYHAAGASKVIRRQCFEQIDGFIRGPGWDTVDEIRAIAGGWSTSHFRELEMLHWKPEGSALGSWRTSTLHGEVYYLTGGGWFFFLLKVLRRVFWRPVFVGSVGLFWGYARSAFTGRKRFVTDDEARCYRKLLNSRMTRRLRLFGFMGRVFH